MLVSEAMPLLPLAQSLPLSNQDLSSKEDDVPVNPLSVLLLTMPLLAESLLTRLLLAESLLTRLLLAGSLLAGSLLAGSLLTGSLLMGW